MLAVSKNPPILSPHVESLTELKGTWWVAHTKSRFEKAFAWDCRNRDIGYFIPLYERTRLIGGKRRRVMVPLFPSYVFFCGTEDDRYQALTTNRLCQTLKVVDQATLTQELAYIEKALQGKAELDPYPHAAVGQRCRVVGGPFRGVEGIVIRRNGVTKVILQVTILAQGTILKIDAGLLEPID